MPDKFEQHEIARILRVKDAIRYKLHDFTLTINKLGPGFTTDFFVSGGCTASMLQGETPKDFDVYFRTKKRCEDVIKLYQMDSYKNEVAVYDEKYRDVDNHPKGLLITENAMTLKNGIQVIIKHYGEPADVRTTFDFKHCLPYYDSKNDKMYISREQYDCCENKILVANEGRMPSAGRIDKFMKRGYKYGDNKIFHNT
jgi:hypothetical protein